MIASGATSQNRLSLSRISFDSGVVGAADQDVGLDADTAQLAHAVLRRLGLGLAGGPDVRHQGDVDVERVLVPQLPAHLADRLQEGLPLDVAHRAADLADHHLRLVVLRDSVDAAT